MYFHLEGKISTKNDRVLKNASHQNYNVKSIVPVTVHCTLYIFSAQTLMKGRLKGAQTGHSLLKKKADALQMRFRLILGKIIEVK